MYGRFLTNAGALFAFQSDYGPSPFFNAVITGEGSVGAPTLEEACEKAERQGMKRESRGLSKAKFAARMSDPRVLGSHDARENRSRGRAATRAKAKKRSR